MRFLTAHVNVSRFFSCFKTDLCNYLVGRFIYCANLLDLVNVGRKLTLVPFVFTRTLIVLENACTLEAKKCG